MATKTQKTVKKTGRGNMTGGKTGPARDVADRLLWYEKQLSEVEAENRILRNAVEELKSEIEEIKKAHIEESDQQTGELVRITDQLIIAKSLIDIPDNIADMVNELLKARVAYWQEISKELGVRWEEKTSVPDVLALDK